MTRFQSAFSKPHPALVCFITAGDGDTAANLDALVEGGADVIERLPAVRNEHLVERVHPALRLPHGEHRPLQLERAEAHLRRLRGF